MFIPRNRATERFVPEATYRSITLPKSHNQREGYWILTTLYRWIEGERQGARSL